MKINAIEVDTDLGRRVVHISPPLEVDPSGDMPPHFRSLTELLWNILGAQHVATCQVVSEGRPSITKAEA